MNVYIERHQNKTDGWLVDWCLTTVPVTKTSGSLPEILQYRV